MIRELVERRHHRAAHHAVPRGGRPARRPIAVIDGGRVIAEGTSDELKARVGGEVLALRLADRRACRRGRGRARWPRSARATTSTTPASPLPVADGAASLIEAVRRWMPPGIEFADIALRRADARRRVPGAHRPRGRGAGEDDDEDRPEPEAPRARSTTSTVTHRTAAGRPLRAGRLGLARRSPSGTCCTHPRKPDLLVFSTIQPVMFVLLFVLRVRRRDRGRPGDVPTSTS